MIRPCALPLLVAALLQVAGCTPGSALNPCPRPEFTWDDYRSAALKLVWDDFNFHPRGNTLLDNVSEADATASRLRPWAEKISDQCMRVNVENWIDYYVRDARDSVERAKRGSSAMSERQQERAAEELRRAALLRAVPAPPKPRPGAE